ncbi:MAG: hypothetical protein LBP42_00295 [Treponema sp.]|nr:hypothetical protein [Treponema sp.]
MFFRRLWVCVCLSLLGSVPLSALTVSFLVIETGLGEGEGRNDFSTLWETSLMDVFFDEGHIVSNAPMMRLPEKPEGEFPREAVKDLQEAREGGADFFILALLDYTGSPAAGNQRPPRTVSLRLFKINPYQFLFKQLFLGTVSASVKDDFLNAKEAVQSIIPRLYE